MSVQSNKSNEPSMEEVLASIRRIISEEMENPSRSTPSSSNGSSANASAFDFPWSKPPVQTAEPAVVQPTVQAVQSAPVAASDPVSMRHPFLPPARTVSTEPVAAPVPALNSATAQSAAPQSGQPTLNNVDFLSSYFADIAQKNAVQAPVSQQASASFVQPVPFAAITGQALLDASMTIQMVPVQTAGTSHVHVDPVTAVDTVAEVSVSPSLTEASATVEQPVAVDPVFADPGVASADGSRRPTPVDVADAMVAAFVQANLLPAHDLPEQQSASVAVEVVEQSVTVAPETTPLPAAALQSEPVASDEPQAAALTLFPDGSEEVVADAVAETVPVAPDEDGFKGLMSDRAAHAFADSLTNLTQSVKSGQPRSVYPRLDEFVSELMKPLVSDWIDQNLERIVEKAVRDEIKRVSKLART